VKTVSRIVAVVITHHQGYQRHLKISMVKYIKQVKM